MVKNASKPKLSKEEKEYRENKFSDLSNIIDKKNLLCTSCNVSVKPTILRGKVKVHPFLETLLCDKCFSFYGDGDFSVDEEDGSDKYCRWCGQGGTLYLCSTCTGGFCKKCIKRNLPRSELKSVESDDWSCYCCEVKPLFDLRALCSAATKYVQENTTQDEADKKKRRRKASVSDQSEEEQGGSGSGSEQDSKKKTPKRKSSSKGSSKDSAEKRLEVKKIRALITKMNSVSQDAMKMCELSKGKLSDLKSKKLSTRYIKDDDTALAVSTKLVNLLESLENLTGKFKTIIKDYVTQWSALNLKQETNGDVDDKNEEAEEEQEKKNESKDESDDSSSLNKTKTGKDEGKRTSSKNDNNDEEDEEKESADAESSMIDDSSEQTAPKKKLSLRTPSTDSKDGGRRKSARGKDDDDSEKSLKRKSTKNSANNDSSDETPKRKRTKKDTEADDSEQDEKSANEESADDANETSKGEEDRASPEHSEEDDD